MSSFRNVEPSQTVTLAGSQLFIKKPDISQELRDHYLSVQIFPNPSYFRGYLNTYLFTKLISLPLNKDPNANSQFYDYYVIEIEELTYERITQVRMKDEIIVPTEKGLIWRGMEFMRIEE